MANDLVPTTAHHNYLVPTQHEAFSLFDEADKALVDQLGQIKDTVFAHQRRALATTYEIALEEAPDAATDYMAAQADFSGKTEAKLSIKKRTHAREATWGRFKIVGSVATLILVLLIARVDVALFVGLFREGFLNQYGELPADMASVVSLIALQAVIAVVGLHLVLNSDKRRNIVAAAIAFLVVLFLIGVVIHRGEIELVKATNVAMEPFGWNIPLSADTQIDRQSFTAILAIFALGIPFLVLPLVGALLTSMAMHGLREGLEARSTYTAFKEGYDAREADLNAAWTYNMQASKLHQDWRAYVKAPLMKLVDARLKEATILSEWGAKSRAFGFPDNGPPLMILGTMVGSIENPDYIVRLATEARAVLGAGFVDREFEAWRVSRGKTSNRLGGF